MGVKFYQIFLGIDWYDHAIFLLLFVNKVGYIVWFSNIELGLHLWNKHHLVIVMLVLCVIICVNFTGPKDAQIADKTVFLSLSVRVFLEDVRI